MNKLDFSDKFPAQLIPLLSGMLTEKDRSFYENEYHHVLEFQELLLQNANKDQILRYIYDVLLNKQGNDYSRAIGFLKLQKSGLGHNISKLPEIRNHQVISHFRNTISALHLQKQFNHKEIIQLFRLHEVLNISLSKLQIHQKAEVDMVWIVVTLLALEELYKIGIKDIGEIGLAGFGTDTDVYTLTSRFIQEYTVHGGDVSLLVKFLKEETQGIYGIPNLYTTEDIHEDTRRILGNILQIPIKNHTVELPLIAMIRRNSHYF